MKPSVRFGNKDLGGLTLFLKKGSDPFGFSVFFVLVLVGLIAGTAWAETVELVTYYPTSSNLGDLHTTSVTVGNDYLNTTLANGQALIQTNLGIGPGFANNQPAAPTLLQVQGVAGQASQALFLPGAGGTMSVGIGTTPVAGSALDVAGDLFVRNSANSNNHVRIRGPSDANTAIELRSETLGGTPYIDFANDAVSDFDMRIQMIGNDDMRIDGGAVQIRKDGGTDITAQLARYGDDLVPTTLSLLHGRGTAAAPTRPQGNDGLGFIRFQGVNTAAQNFDGATIQAVAAANWTAASAPASLIFSTTPVNATGSAERMRITEAGNMGIGNTYAPLTAASNGLNGNIDANDVFLRNGNRWASQVAGGSAAPDAFGTYTGNGALDRFIATNFTGTANGFRPGYVYIWQQHTVTNTPNSHLHIYQKWANQPTIPGQTADHSFYIDSLLDDNIRLTYLEIRAGNNGFRVGAGSTTDTNTDRFETNVRNSPYFWMAWD